MGLILDLLVLVLIAYFVVNSARRGFVRVFIETVGFVAAILLAMSVSAALSDVIYQKAVEPAIIKTAAEGMDELSEDAVLNVWDALPEYVTDNAEILGIDMEKVNNMANDYSDRGTEQAVVNVSQNLIKPAATRIIELIITFILSTVFLIVVKFVARFLNRIFSFSLVGKLNTALGGIVGIFKGAVIAAVFCMIVALIISFTKNGFLIFTNENIASSNIFSFFVNIFR